MDGFSKSGELLARLCEIGRPQLSRRDNGFWHACVTFPAPEGVTAEVRSSFDHKTPDEALQVCIDRLGGLQDMLSVPTPQVRTLRAIEV
jgi:hypothetical protein